MPKEPQSYGSQGPHQGGDVSEEQASEQARTAQASDAIDTSTNAARRVADIEGGARRDGFFKKRDYGS